MNRHCIVEKDFTNPQSSNGMSNAHTTNTKTTGAEHILHGAM
jgi:hypothetical protein